MSHASELFYRFLNCQCADKTQEAFDTINELSDLYLNGQGHKAYFPGSKTAVPAEFVHNTVVTFSLALEQLKSRESDMREQRMRQIAHRERNWPLM